MTHVQLGLGTEVWCFQSQVNMQMQCFALKSKLLVVEMRKIDLPCVKIEAWGPLRSFSAGALRCFTN